METDGNKKRDELNDNFHEAQKALKIAEEAYNLKDFEKALKFVNKAYLLYPTSNTKKLKKICEEKLEATRQHKEQRESEEGHPQHRRHTQPQRSYSKEDHEACRKILEKTNFYDILGFSDKLNSCCINNKKIGICCILNIDQNEIKKSYKRLSLRCHPDKNGSPLANEAFKLLSKAAAFTINPEKARNEMNNQQQNPNEPNEFNPFDVFDSFFKNSTNEENDHRVNELRYVFFMFAPIIIIIMAMLCYNIYMLNFNKYSLIQTGDYKVHLQSDKQKIDYYITQEMYRYLRLLLQIINALFILYQIIYYNRSKYYELDALVEKEVYQKHVEDCQTAKNQRAKIRAKAFKADNEDDYLQQIDELEHYSYNSCANAKRMKKIDDEHNQRRNYRYYYYG